MKIAIIPARKGSKRIKNKNIKLFNGKPIISYSIQTAIRSKIFDRIICSTDCNKIAKIAINYGATVPFKRSKKYSDDYTSTQSVIKYIINKLKLDSNSSICCIYPTTPFLSYKDIIKSYNILTKNKNRFVFAATKYRSNPYRSFKLNKKNYTKMVFSKYYNNRSQNLQNLYYDSGQYYWGYLKTWMKNKKIFDNSIILETDPLKSIDINTIEDWQFAEQIYKSLK